MKSTTVTLIRLSECPRWSESSLDGSGHFICFCFAEAHIKMFMQHLCMVHILPITLPRELELHGAFCIGSMQLIVLWSDDDDDDDCCDGGGAEWVLWWWSYAAWGISPISQINKLNKTVSCVFKHWVLYRISKGSPVRLFSICISNRSPSCFLKRRASAKGASDRESAMNNQRVKWQKWLALHWTCRLGASHSRHKGWCVMNPQTCCKL